MKRAFLLCCSLSILLSGCVLPTETSPPTVDIGITDVSEHRQNNEITFNGTLEILDYYGGDFVIEDVRIEFLGETGEVLRTVRIGAIQNTSFRRQIAANLSRPPGTVRIRTGEIETDASVAIHGLERNGTGGLDSYYQGT